MSSTRPELGAKDILAALDRRGVRYVVIGAFAAIAHGAPIDATYDVDVTPQRDPRTWTPCRTPWPISMPVCGSTISKKACRLP